MSEATTKTKIAILGGGVGALAAAFDLIEADPRDELYDITVYQLGWRLGGKGAVGWTCDKYPTPGFKGLRVQLEHGLHVWAGFYDNAFDLMKRLYAANETLRGRSFMEHFTPVDHCWVMDKGTGSYQRWLLEAPRNGSIPGLSRFPPSPASMWRRLLAWASEASADEGLTAHLDKAATHAPLEPTQQEMDFAARASAIVERRGATAFGVRSHEKARASALVGFATKRLRAAHFDPDFMNAHAFPQPERMRRLFIMIDVAVALVLGMLEEGVLVNGFDGLDRWEWSEWMAAHGASQESLSSGLVRAFYEYVFGYEADGNRNVAAGTATRALLRLILGYKGSLFYRLDTTMGEFLFTPLYETLVARGVKFEFFSRVDKLHLSADKKSIEKIDIGIQAKLKNPNKPYNPLVEIPGSGKSWPARPNYEQLDRDKEIYAKLTNEDQDLESPWNSWGVVDKKTLSRVRNGIGDFDNVILGISLGALGSICEDLAKEPSLRWGDMLANVGTCPTVASQLWTKKATSAYKWPPEGTVVTSFAAPLGSWGDNSQLLDGQAWPAGRKPHGFGYFVGNLFPVDKPPALNAPSNFPVAQLKHATQKAAVWLADDLPTLWPGFKPSDLARDAWVRVNVNPSDRYVQSLTGSVTSRLAPDGSGLDNLFLAGDWVRIGLNAGCIEQAVIGGRAAARAITGVDMNSAYDGDRNWDDEPLLPPSLTALFSNLPNLSKLAYAGVGSVDARCIVWYVPPDIIEKSLPPGLCLKLGARRPAELPIVLLFSEQSNVRPSFAPFGGICYLEVAIVMNGVYLSNPGDHHPGPYIYMPKLLLNSLAPTAIGTNLYGFRKQLARMQRVGDSFQVHNDEGHISGSFRDASLLGHLSDFSEANLLREFLGYPIISKTPQGDFTWCSIDYHLERASFQSLVGLCSINQGHIKGHLEVKPIPGPDDPARATEQGRSAFGVRMIADWSITLPVRMGELEKRMPRPKREHAAAMTSQLIARLRGRR